MALLEPTTINLINLLTYEKNRKKKYGGAANRNGLAFVAAIFSYAGQMHKDIKHLLLEQIRLKLQLVDGEVKKSKVQAIMKHCVRSIYAAINRSATSKHTLRLLFLLERKGYLFLLLFDEEHFGTKALFFVPFTRLLSNLSLI